MYYIELAYRVRQEQYADLRRAAARERLAKAFITRPQRRFRVRGIGRDLLNLLAWHGKQLIINCFPLMIN